MNPEIRFRVSDDIYQKAEERAEEMGLAGPGAGRSAGVPLLARAALYDWLELSWPEEYPQLTQGSLRATARPQESLSRVAQATLKVTHQVREEARWNSAIDGERALPQLCQSILQCPPHQVPKAARPYLRLAPSGDLQGQVQLLDLVAHSEELTWAELEAFLKERQVARKETRAHWENHLQAWVLEKGSELLQARLEEGFDWFDLAEQEWAEYQVQMALQAESPLQRVQDQQSLRDDQEFHALLPDRQPNLPRIQLLRHYRGRLGPDSALRLSLVEGRSERTEARKRSASKPFRALLWQVDLPSGAFHSFLSHLELT